MGRKLSRRGLLRAAAGCGAALLTGACARSEKLGRVTSAAGSRAPWKAGLATIHITPNKPLWMGGFSARTKPSDGTLQELNAKALALEDQTGGRAVLVTTDLIGLPGVVSKSIAEQARKRYRLSRDRLLFNSSHTHSGPVLANPLQITYRALMSAAQWRDVEQYTRGLENKVVAVIGDALKDLKPARLSFGHSQTNFAVNRRLKTDKGWVSSTVNPQGPVDHVVPFLRVDSDEGRLRGAVFGYACHNTTLISDNYKFCGDYAGFAQEQLEKRHPDATAMFVAGCAADANPNPRGTVALAQKYGEMLAGTVDHALGGSLMPVRGPLKSAFAVFPVTVRRAATHSARKPNHRYTDMWSAVSLLPLFCDKVLSANLRFRTAVAS